jgi:hypothetical protein
VNFDPIRSLPQMEFEPSAGWGGRLEN